MDSFVYTNALCDRQKGPLKSNSKTNISQIRARGPKRKQTRREKKHPFILQFIVNAFMETSSPGVERSMPLVRILCVLFFLSLSIFFSALDNGTTNAQLLYETVSSFIRAPSPLRLKRIVIIFYNAQAIIRSCFIMWWNRRHREITEADFCFVGQVSNRKDWNKERCNNASRSKYVFTGENKWQT